VESRVEWEERPEGGELAGNRTQDPRLKRALLYQLSYELVQGRLFQTTICEKSQRRRSRSLLAEAGRLLRRGMRRSLQCTNYCLDESNRWLNYLSVD
jgi:hypothetical protein